MQNEISFLLLGVALGLSGGFSPGPLTTLIVSQSLRYGVREGIKVAVAPVLTDLPIIIITIYLISRMANFNIILGIISMLGGCFLFYLGIASIAFKRTEIETVKVNPQSIKKGIITNFLNPAPYMFWISIGAPTVIKAKQGSFFSVILFIAGIYFFLVGSKIGIAFLTGKSRSVLKSNIYIGINRILGLILILYGVLFFKDGLQAIGLF